MFHGLIPAYGNSTSPMLFTDLDVIENKPYFIRYRVICKHDYIVEFICNVSKYLIDTLFSGLYFSTSHDSALSNLRSLAGSTIFKSKEPVLVFLKDKLFGVSKDLVLGFKTLSLYPSSTCDPKGSIFSSFFGFQRESETALSEHLE